MFTAKDTRLVGEMLFLANMITSIPEGTLPMGVYRKPIHSDQYLQWDSYHHIAVKYVINTHTHRTRTVCSAPELLGTELQHLQAVLTHCRTLGERFQEHFKESSPSYEHQSSTAHATSLQNFSIIGRERHNLIRIIKGSIYIGVNTPTLNMSNVKYNFPHFWGRVLFTTRELKIKNQQEQRESKTHKTMLVPSTLRNVVKEIISRGPSISRGILEENIPCRPDEAIL